MVVLDCRSLHKVLLVVTLYEGITWSQGRLWVATRCTRRLLSKLKAWNISDHSTRYSARTRAHSAHTRVHSASTRFSRRARGVQPNSACASHLGRVARVRAASAAQRPSRGTKRARGARRARALRERTNHARWARGLRATGAYRLFCADWFPISTVQYRIEIRCEDWKFSFCRVRKYETQMSKYLFFVYFSFGFI